LDKMCPVLVAGGGKYYFEKLLFLTSF